jgi:hypothetical protein
MGEAFRLLLALINGERFADELKYLLRDLTTTVNDALFEVPFRRAGCTPMQRLAQTGSSGGGAPLATARRARGA